MLLYRAPGPSEMKRSVIELAVLVRAKAEKKVVQACLLRADFILMYRAPSPSEMKRSEIELAVLVSTNILKF